MEHDPQGAAESQESAPQAMPRCPQCGWQDVRLSRPRTALDAALSMFSVAPFRCRTCGARFYRYHRRRETES